jgi:hypothetical protein
LPSPCSISADVRLAAHRQLLDLLAHALPGVRARKWRGLDTMRVGAQFATASAQTRDGVDFGLALVQLRLDLDRRFNSRRIV